MKDLYSFTQWMTDNNPPLELLQLFERCWKSGMDYAVALESNIAESAKEMGE